MDYEREQINFLNSIEERSQIFEIERTPWDIRFIDNPSERVQLAAVKQEGLAIRFIKNPTERVKIAAVRQSPEAIYSIENPSEEVQLAAVRTKGDIIVSIKNPSERVQIAAVRQMAKAIDYIENPSEAVQLAAVQKNGNAIRYIQMAAVLQNRNPSEEVQMAAVLQNHNAIRHIANPSERVKKAAFWKRGMRGYLGDMTPPSIDESFDSVINNIINEAFGDQCPECNATLGMKDGEPCSHCETRPAPICHECGWPIYGSSDSHDYDDSHLDTDCSKCGRPGGQLSCERNRGTPYLYRHPRA